MAGIIEFFTSGIAKVVGSVKGLFNTDYDPYDERHSWSGSKYDYKDGGGTEYYQALVKAGSISGIFGMPFQFLPSVDPRYTDIELQNATDRESNWNNLIYNSNNKTSNTNKNDADSGSFLINMFSGIASHITAPLHEKASAQSSEQQIAGVGRMYGSKIVSKAPLLFLIPCIPKFMEDSSKKTRNKTLKSLKSTGVLSKKYIGKYYTTQYAFAEYSKVIDTMITLAAVNMGVANNTVKLNGEDVKLSEYTSQNSLNKGLDQYIGAYGQEKQAIVYYVDGSDVQSIQETMSNSVTDSSLAQSLSGYSQQANELIYLMGENSAVKQMKSMRDQIASGNNLGMDSDSAGAILKDLSSEGITTILHGGKLLFPKIWSDSSFNRSYSFTIKLRSPYHDNYSIFLEIIIPLLHLIGLVLPRTMKEDGGEQNPNAYRSPFLVRAYMKGLFNIDMGLITDMTITRGAECQWNDDGLPTQVDVNLSIEDLYQNLRLTDPYVDSDGVINKITNQFGTAAAIVSNDAMVDYLANLSGLNVIAQPGDYEKQARYSVYLHGAGMARTPARWKEDFENLLNNTIRNWSNND